MEKALGHVRMTLERKAELLLVILCITLTGGIAYLWIQNDFLTKELALIRSDAASSTAIYKTMVEAKRAQLDQTTFTLNQTMSALQYEQQRTGEFQTVLSGLQGSVTQITKTNSVDEELLAKYSKVYFLNENYVPKAVAPIDLKYTYDGNKAMSFQAQALPFLVRLLDSAEAQGYHLRLVSAYRTFDEQKALKSIYKTTYGTGANAFSADQGYSEHQLGTTIDFTTKELAANFSNFAKATSYKWLQDNAWQFGFILSYPSGNTYYQFEPWHWRFVGLSLARHLHETGKNFYDMDQREIDTYRGTLFD